MHKNIYLNRKIYYNLILIKNMKEYVKIRRVGNSLGFTVPAEIVKSENIKENKLIEFSVKNFGNSRKIIKLIL